MYFYLPAYSYPFNTYAHISRTLYHIKHPILAVNVPGIVSPSGAGKPGTGGSDGGLSIGAWAGIYVAGEATVLLVMYLLIPQTKYKNYLNVDEYKEDLEQMGDIENQK